MEGRAGESDWTDYLRALRARLSGRTWASYHDRFTREGDQVIDHLTGGDWVRGLVTREFDWDLTARSRHRIAAVTPGLGERPANVGPSGAPPPPRLD